MTRSSFRKTVNGLIKFALVAAVVACSGGAIFAQQRNTTPPAVKEDAAPAPIEAAQDADRPRPGWTVGAGGNVLMLFDTNPLFERAPRFDTGQQYMGRLIIHHVGKNSEYAATYVPATTRYKRNFKLDSVTHSFEQNFHYRLSRANQFGWMAEVRKFPAWTGNSLANSSMGALIMALSGANGLDLLSNVTTGRTGMTLDHAIDNRSRLHFSAAGGVTQYRKVGSNPFLNLLMRPDSKTWMIEGKFGFERNLDRHRTIALGATHTYFRYTPVGGHQHVDELSVRLAQRFQNKWDIAVGAGPVFVTEQLGSVAPTIGLSAEANRTDAHSVFHASLNRRFRPGLEPGTLSSWDAVVSYDRALSRRWMAGLYTNFQKSSAQRLILNARNDDSEVYMFAAQLGFRLQRNVTWIANYGYSVQRGIVTGYEYTGRQQFMTGISFQFDNILRH